MATNFSELYQVLLANSPTGGISSTTLKDVAIHVLNPNGDINNPKSDITTGNGQWTYRIIEHLNGGGVGSLSHEVVATSHTTGHFIEGDAVGYTYFNDGIVGGGSPSQNPNNIGKMEYVSQAPTYNRGPHRSFRDVLKGSSQNDIINSKTGDDQLYGNGGDDILNGGTGNDEMYGGIGRDFLFGEGGNDTLNGGADDDYLDGGDGNNYINGQAGDDMIVVGSGTNQIWGDEAGAQRYYNTVDYSTHASTQIMYTNTTVNGAQMIQVIKSGGVVDSLFNIDQVIASNAGAGIAGNDSANDLKGGLGADTIVGNAGNDTIYGYDGANQIDGGADNDLIYGGADDGESIWGGAGDDTIHGNGGSDFIYGGDGNDYIVCGSGFGLAEGGAGADTIASLDGNDVAIYVNSLTGVIFELTEEKSTEGLFVGRGYGSTDNPNLESAGDLTIGFRAVEGSTFADSIYGNSQDNVLAGNAGNDTLCGNAGSDTLQGGAGDDYFVFGNGSGYDYIFEGADEGQQDVGFFIGITSINVYKMWDHLMLAANGDTDVMVLDKWYSNGGVELIYFQDVDVAYSAADLAAMAYDITPASTFSGEAGVDQAKAILPVGISSADVSNFFDAAQLTA